MGLDLMVLGGTAPYHFVWSDGSDLEDLVAGAGTYTVTVTDDRGCGISTPAFTIGAGEGPTAGAEVSATTTLVNVPVTFTSTSTEGEVVWAFGDGQISTEAAPQHSYSTPGTYTVSLTVTNGECSDTWTMEMQVETSTPARVSIPAEGLSTGVWFVRVGNTSTTRTVRVPLVR